MNQLYFRNGVAALTLLCCACLDVGAQETDGGYQEKIPFTNAPIVYSESSATNEMLTLSLPEVIQLALQNNLDVEIADLNRDVAEFRLRAEYGIYDPALNISVDRQVTERPGSERREWNYESFIQGFLPTGTRYDIGLQQDEISLSSRGFNPEFSAFGGVSVTQPLLRNFGFAANLADIRIARRQRTISTFEFARQVMSTLNAVNEAYYNLNFAYQNHAVQEESLKIAQTLLTENRKRFEVGVMSSLEVTQANAGVAEREEDVIVARQQILEASNLLKSLISSDIRSIWDKHLVLVDQPSETPVEIDVQKIISNALQRRPDYLQARLRRDIQNITVNALRNNRLPQVDLRAAYGYESEREFTFEGSLQDLRLRENPSWSVGVVVSIPLGNIAARNSVKAAKAQLRQAELEVQSTEQQILVEVDNAAAQVRTDVQRIAATRAARTLALESLRAEQARLNAGTSTSFLVLQAQRDYSTARVNEIRAVADYNISLANLALAEATILERFNVRLDEKQWN